MLVDELFGNAVDVIFIHTASLSKLIAEAFVWEILRRPSHRPGKGARTQKKHSFSYDIEFT